ncbi:hypothetical protein PVK06_046998 [Gossypium arboreum]|uniref:Uncharacterized protein n=1 Tax=Gossypium arboreum TaxID=29729 RepID=A0ABR0MCJ8_GOSAR|nr:hypothetical protein PVK06_046998 [Gossypium arboreum]
MIIRFDMPRRCVNVIAKAQEDGTSAPPVPSCRVNILDEGVSPLIEVMIGAFQRIDGANPTPALQSRTC